MKRFRDRLREARENAGLSQERLADLAGLNRQNYVGIETGRRPVPKEDTLQKIAAVKELGVDFPTLRTWKYSEMLSDEAILEEAKRRFPDCADGLEKCLNPKTKK